MEDFKKEVIFFDENKFNNLLEPQFKRLGYFQELVSMYENLNTGEPLLSEDLKALIENPKEFVAKQIVKEDTATIGGLKLNFEKVFDIIEKPVGTDELINKIINDKLIDKLNIAQRNAYHFEIENGYTVILNKEYVKQITEQCTVYITSENQKKAFKILNEIAKNVNELSSLKARGYLHENLFQDYFSVNVFTETITINPYFGKLIR